MYSVWCIVSGILLILSFPNFNLPFFAWFAFVPLFFAIQDKKPSQAFLLGYITGLIFFLGSIYWLIHVTLLGYALLCLYLALYFGVFTFLLNYRPYAIGYRLLSIPALWVLLEYLRTNFPTGFGWNLLAYSQYKNLAVIQLADLTGVYGVSFLIMIVNVAIYHVIKPVRGHAIRSLLVSFLCIAIALSYGFFKLNQKEEGNFIKISVIQGNIPQHQRWDPEYEKFIFDRYEILTKEASGDKPDLIIWPETALPGYFESNKELTRKMRELTRRVGTPILFGAPVSNYNSAILLDANGKTLKRYDKLHLVPFGEYVPFERWLGFIHNIAPAPIGNFAPGSEYTVFELAYVRSPQSIVRGTFSVLICFEDIFPSLSRQFIQNGTNLLVNITNDAWFKETAAPYQHAQASAFRAVENRVNVIRAANTGLSCFIDNKGSMVSRVKNNRKKDIFIEGFDTQLMKIGKTASFYTRYGDIFAYICILIFLHAFIRQRST